MNALQHIQQIGRNLKEFQRSLPEIVLESVKANENEVIDLNTEEQLFQQGIGADGQPLTPTYRPLTISIKQSKGQPTDRVTLRDEGDFHRSFFISYGNDSFALGASDSKAQKLEKKYGKEIFGLTDQSLSDAIQIVKPDIFSKSRKIIFR